MSKVTPHDSSGTTFTFPGFTGDVTGITFNKSTREMIDTPHFGQTTGAFIRRQAAPLKSPSTVSVEFIGIGSIAGGTTGTLSISGGIAVSGSATCMSTSISLSVGDVIRGSAEFEVED
jgi:hypothetical protein